MAGYKLILRNKFFRLDTQTGMVLKCYGRGDTYYRCDEYEEDVQMEKQTPYFDCVFKQLSKLLICPYVFIAKCFSLNCCYHLKEI